MIKLKNVSKKFDHEEVLWKIDELTFPDTGLVVIHGPSGSGKSTLLHLIGGLDLDYNGDILLDNINLKKLEPARRDHYRFQTIGFVMQRYYLLEATSIKQNLLLPLLAKGITKFAALKKVRASLKTVGLNKNINQMVSTLSGGEKQRLSLARALINEPKYLLCDEPTGALDEANKKVVLEILKKVSKTRLVLLVTHDLESIEEDADMIVELKNSRFHLRKQFNVNNNSLVNIKVASKEEAKLPLKFALTYNFKQLKRTPVRAFITNIVTSLGLVGIGLSFILTSSVNKRLESALQGVSNPHAIVMKAKAPNKNPPRIAASKYQVQSVYNRYSHFFNHLGALYEYNFEANFKDADEVYIANVGYKVKLPSFHIRHFSEYLHISEVDNTSFYPKFQGELALDEVILGIPTQDLEQIKTSRYLHRGATIEDVGNTLLNNQLTIALHVANDDWQYDDERLFLVKAMFASDEAIIVHTNPLFNEILLEEEMRLKSTNTFEGAKALPWTLTKSYYLQAKISPFKVIEHFLHELSLSNYVLHGVIEKEQPHLYKILPTNNRLAFFDIGRNYYSHAHADQILSLSEEVNSYYAYSESIYLAEPDLLMSGFYSPLFLSGDYESLNEALNAASIIHHKDEGVDVIVPYNMLKAHYSIRGKEGLTYATFAEDNLTKGRGPTTIDEIVISTSLYEKLFPYQDFKEQSLYLGYLIETRPHGVNFVQDFYKQAKVNIVGLINHEFYGIFQSPAWLNIFFSAYFNLPIFSTLTSGFVLDVNSNDIEALVAKLNQQFFRFEFSAPMNDTLKQISNTLDNIRLGMLFIASFAVIISLLLIILINYLTIKERINEVGLLGLIGFSAKERVKLFIVNGILLAFIAFISASLMLVVVEVILNKAFINLGFGAAKLTLNPVSFTAMFLMSTLIGVLASYISTINLSKTDIIPLLYN